MMRHSAPRRTVVIGKRPVRIAGAMPPMTPTAMAHPRPSRIDSVVTRNAKANWKPAAGLSVDAVIAVENCVHDGGAQETPGERNHGRLDQNRHDHRNGLETERAEGRDLDRAPADGGEHRGPARRTPTRAP